VLIRKDLWGWVWWYMPVIPATWEVEIGGSQCKKCEILSENKLKHKHLGHSSSGRMLAEQV
jgi:hypothetical protein